jgi:Rps23 Pro-64 3,4-dihydroxylase Tpa1-like proline 4-hydroxylase
MTDPRAGADQPTMTAPYLVVDDFLPAAQARAMRDDIERHFGTPDKHRAESHQVWNYWYVENTYTYLRTMPERLMGNDKVAAFVDSLRQFSAARLGHADVTTPLLSLYVDGCNQQFHNDATNGRFAYVYSLTKSPRQTIGGGTIVMNDGDLYRRNLANPMAWRGFCDVIEPRFNRLVIFDDRVMHAVERVEGSMDPVEGRFVLHGHIRDAGPMLGGALTYEQAYQPLQDAVSGFVSLHGAEAHNFHGPISLRFLIEPHGSIAGLTVLMDRVTHVEERHAGDWPALRAKYIAAVSTARFPAAAGATTVILPMFFSGPYARPPGG